MEHPAIPFQLILHPIRYAKRWSQIYRIWEFWAFCAVVIAFKLLLDATGHTPQYLVQHTDVAKVLWSALIMVPVPYFIVRREERLKRSKGRQQTLGALLIPRSIAALLIASAISFCLPVFVDATTKQPLSGLGLISHHLLVAGLPLLFVITALTALVDYKGWRWTVLLWCACGFVLTFAVAGLYTDMDHDIAPAYEVPALILQISPIIAVILCLLPYKEATKSAKRRSR